jgi:threonine/homoserine/homoserine lactone efflux protein
MLDPGLFTAFLVALLLLELSPGPDMMLILARGIGQGRRIALLTMVGMIFVAGAVQVGLLVLGLASLIATWPAALTAIRLIGAAYLVFLGAKLLHSSLRPGSQTSKVTDVSDWQAVRQGVVNSLTNPKSLLFMFAFLPQFVDPSAGPVWLQLLILGVIQKLAGVLSLGGVALASGAAGRWLARNGRLILWQERFTALVLIGLGLRLALTGGDAAARDLPRPR